MKEPWNRRELLGRGMELFGFGLASPYFLGKTAWALRWEEETNSSKTEDDRILIVLQLAGGNDGLNTVIPYRQDAYYRFRPQIAIGADQVLQANDDFGFHPAAVGLKRLFDEGRLAVVHGVGYPNPTRSHFEGTDIWESADIEKRTYTGWLGRYMDRCCSGSEAPAPEAGISITQEVPLALQGERFSPVCFESPDQLQWKGHPTNRGGARVFEQLNGVVRKSDAEQENKAFDFVRKASIDSRLSAEQIRRAAEGKGRGKGKTSLAAAKNSLGSQLDMVLQMIQAGLKTRIYYVSLGGFDTHSNQSTRHQALMKELGSALASFSDRLRESRLDERVLLMSFSEFGRRVSQNGSQGTDHGTAAPLFVLGGNVRSGFHGAHPNLDDLDRGDLRFTTDFRSVYATVLDRWLGAPAESILGERYPTLPILGGS